jgi:hypothetical protein
MARETADPRIQVIALTRATAIREFVSDPMLVHTRISALVQTTRNEFSVAAIVHSALLHASRDAGYDRAVGGKTPTRDVPRL